MHLVRSNHHSISIIPVFNRYYYRNTWEITNKHIKNLENYLILESNIETEAAGPFCLFVSLTSTSKQNLCYSVYMPL